MRGLSYRDKYGHPSESSRAPLVKELMQVIRELVKRPGGPAPPAAGRDPLGKEDYAGWEADLRETNGVMHPMLREKRGVLHPRWTNGWFWCALCER